MIDLQTNMKEVILSDFVKSTIVEIIKGVEEAKNELAELDVYINPHVNKEGVMPTSETERTFRRVQNINFDLMVSAESAETSESQNTIGILMKVISFIGFGVNLAEKESDLLKNNSVNRISFSVPISLSTNTKGKAGEFRSSAIPLNSDN